LIFPEEGGDSPSPLPLICSSPFGGGGGEAASSSPPADEAERSEMGDAADDREVWNTS
jgi:hypothetical protein